MDDRGRQEDLPQRHLLAENVPPGESQGRHDPAQFLDGEDPPQKGIDILLFVHDLGVHADPPDGVRPLNAEAYREHSRDVGIDVGDGSVETPGSRLVSSCRDGFGNGLCLVLFVVLRSLLDPREIPKQSKRAQAQSAESGVQGTK